LWALAATITGRQDEKHEQVFAKLRNAMSRFNLAADRSIGQELERVVEPLAAYICATEQPKTALMSALAVLFREVEATNSAAAAHFRAFMQN
jgi:hypothetical protein